MAVQLLDTSRMIISTEQDHIMARRNPDPARPQMLCAISDDERHGSSIPG
jgi:hypothetical protein